MYKSNDTETSQTSSYRSFPLCEVVREDTEAPLQDRELPLTSISIAQNLLVVKRFIVFL